MGLFDVGNKIGSRRNKVNIAQYYQESERHRNIANGGP